MADYFDKEHTNHYTDTHGKNVTVVGRGVTDAPDDFSTAVSQHQQEHPGNMEPVLGWHTTRGDNGEPVREWIGYAGQEPPKDPESMEGKIITVDGKGNLKIVDPEQLRIIDAIKSTLGSIGAATDVTNAPSSQSVPAKPPIAPGLNK